MAAQSHFKPPLSTSATPEVVLWDERLARVVSDVASPPVLALIAIFLSIRAVQAPAMWRWAAFYVVLVVLVPCLYILWLVRRGEVTDFHIPRREQRMRPFLVTAVCAFVAWLTLLVGHAPRLFVLLAAAGWMKIGLMWLVTLRWKISVHAVAAAALAVLAWSLLGPVALPLAAGVPLVAWSRVRLKRHDVWQTVAGAALGVLVLCTALLMTPRG